MNFKEFLTEQYKLQFPNPKKQDCLRIFYTFNDVKVHLYFDAYFEEECNLFLILNYNKISYFTNLDIRKIHTSPFLKNIREKSREIFFKVLVDGNLDKFYEQIRKHIEDYQPHSYKDTHFKTHSKGGTEAENPFFWYLKNVKMSEEHLRFLKERTPINYKILKAIQDKGFTVATTDDIEKRGELAMFLQNHKINIK